MPADLFAPELPGLFILLGAMGSGKTEFSLNLALSFAARGARAALADLDVVNPYFRSREQGDALSSAGVRLVAPGAEAAAADLPAIPAELRALLVDEGLSGVLDIGGGRTGARVLGAYAPEIKRRDPSVWYVFNRARRDNATAKRALDVLRGIEAASGVAATGIVHNTHLLSQTAPEDILEGAAAAEELSGLSGLPVVCHAARADLVPSLARLTPLFPMRLHLMRPWEDKEP